MEPLKNLTIKKRLPTKRDPHLHSASHLLADELSTKLRDKQHFGFYLKMAVSMPHGVLRKILGDVLESKNAKTPGRLFAYLVKQYNAQRTTDKKSPIT